MPINYLLFFFARRWDGLDGGATRLGSIAWSFILRFRRGGRIFGRGFRPGRREGPGGSPVGELEAIVELTAGRLVGAGERRPMSARCKVASGRVGQLAGGAAAAFLPLPLALVLGAWAAKRAASSLALCAQEFAHDSPASPKSAVFCFLGGQAVLGFDEQDCSYNNKIDWSE